MHDLFSGIIRRMFTGRCGYDELSRFLALCIPVPFLLAVLLRSTAGGYPSMFLLTLAMVLFLWSLWRAFSTNLYYRKKENEQFMASPLYRSVSNAAVRFSQRKQYAFFRCRKCRHWLRVPRGAGKIEIRCPECGNSFIKKV
jgi:LSD1 subclass zinc finger protein